MNSQELTEQVRDLARTIAAQAQAIADGTVAHTPAACARVEENARTLKAWAIDANLRADIEAHEAGQ